MIVSPPRSSPRARLLEKALSAGLLMLLAAAVGLLVWQTLAPVPWRGAGLSLDRLSAALALLVTGVGAATFRFSQRYLAGELGRARFLGWLAFTVLAATVLMLASHLLLLFAAWALTSFGLHELLTHYADRPQAIPPARKKLLISRLGDLALLAAILLIGLNWKTLDLHVFLERAAVAPQGALSTAVALLIVIAALTKSAQFPFHSWLPETMEAPTPVSALMHAGVINAGGALLLRFAPLLVGEPAALLLLSAVGTLTLVLGMLAMWAQVKIKRVLAWSTVNQLGFMMIQCGLAAFPAAALHIVGHGGYKAWRFLGAGTLPDPAPAVPSPSPLRALGLLSLGALVCVPLIALAGQLTGFRAWHAPGELALSAVVALAGGQLWVAALGSVGINLKRVGVVGLLTTVGVLAVFLLYRGAEQFLAPVLGPLAAPQGPLAWGAALLPVTALVLLSVLQAWLPALTHAPRARAWYVHALHGFYFGALADRLVDALWRRFVKPSPEVARD